MQNDCELLVKQAQALISPEDPLVTNLANLSALLMQSLPSLNWAGFYLASGKTLVLGPFQGKTACTRIPLGQGVCGTSAAQNRSVRVADVHAFCGHIACDSASNAELVTPLRDAEGRVCGVIDLDSTEYDRFTVQDQRLLETLADCLKPLLHPQEVARMTCGERQDCI